MYLNAYGNRFASVYIIPLVFLLFYLFNFCFRIQLILAIASLLPQCCCASAAMTKVLVVGRCEDGTDHGTQR